MANAYGVERLLLSQIENRVCSLPAKLRAADALKVKVQDLEIKVLVPLSLDGELIGHDDRKVNSAHCLEVAWTAETEKISCSEVGPPSADDLQAWFCDGGAANSLHA
jgi:hypothetical protein